MYIARDLLRYGKKDNSKQAEGAKRIVRENVLREIGAENARVFDAFAGAGAMYRTVWHQAAECVGCDEDWFPQDERLAFKCDNRRVLRALDLSQFNVFDLDAHGSMWEQLYLIAARRPVVAGERIGLTITEGLGLKMNMGGTGKALAKLARIQTHMPGMGAARNDIIERGLRAVFSMMHATVEKRWQAQGTKGSRVLYLGLVLRAD